MSAALGTTLSHHGPAGAVPPLRATHDPLWVRWTLTTIALLFLAFFLVLPLAAAFLQAVRRGARASFAALSNPDAISAIKLTLTTAAISVPLNVAFGISAAWAISKFD